MDFSIRPYEGVGPLRIGMSVEKVRATVGRGVVVDSKGSDTRVPTDIFVGLGIHAHYTNEGLSEAFEICEPSSPTFQGKELVGKPFGELREWFEQLDDQIESDGAGVTSYKYGVGLYAPFAEDEPDKPVEAVIVFAHGYYDR